MVSAEERWAYLLGEVHNELIDGKQDVGGNAKHVPTIVLELGLLKRALHKRVDGGDQMLWMEGRNAPSQRTAYS